MTASVSTAYNTATLCPSFSTNSLSCHQNDPLPSTTSQPHGGYSAELDALRQAYSDLQQYYDANPGKALIDWILPPPPRPEPG
ncbi:hypothetical protein BDB00DRAFT_834227 [Zychaea mexicana]|uniref:uncharacterized protein n=1 Tax=Zychaea mexicana TaxID=64656 RepID=UPI0022FE9A81|nr:uncharacterized protein BDB00DRAFT_834227 [Zychaea mexicana]KAI9491201.1 hypothetical protein BDB00DRAFT_834227 [Zychaea mexicana]